MSNSRRIEGSLLPPERDPPLTETRPPQRPAARTGAPDGWPRNDRERYWIEKLGPFRHGTPMLPFVSVSSGGSQDDHDDEFRRVIPVPAGGVSPIEILGLGALALVVGRYNGGEPLLVASPAGQASAEFRFLTCTCDERLDVKSLLARLGAEVEESRQYEPCDLALVASGLELDAAAVGRTFLQLAYAVGPAAGNREVRDRADLALWLEPRDRELHLQVTAGNAARSPLLVQQLTEHVARAIQWLVENSGAQLSDFELLSDVEQQRIAGEFNSTSVPVQDGLTLHGLVAAQAVRTPDAIAVVHRAVELTYRSLDEQASHIATILRRDYGVTTGGIVGVMMERSEKTVVALYGVMKAGAAYVPITPRHPWDTVRFMLENAGVSVLIVDSDSVAAAASFSGELLVLDIELAGSPAAVDPGVPVGETDLAYVIYTSGSTGRPKGVAVEHRAVVNTILWRNAFYGIGPADVNLQMPSFAFDSSVVDIFCVLTAGGALVIPDEELRLDARRLIALAVARQVTSCIVTPSYYARLISELGGAVPSLRWVTLAGESATPQLVEAHLERLPGVALYNEYGPTENAVCSTACRLDKVETTVSIGRPIANVSVFIVDAHNRLCPIGVPGEVYLGGVGLARGYLGQDQLTDERFVPSPVPSVYEGRLYRTGDRGSWRADGALDFLGRFDSQVKVRGFRIELDEVELALMRSPGVRNAAVTCKEDASGTKYLAAYAEAHAGVATVEVREHMRSQLPEYMVPDVLTLVPRLPLNLNGKIDREALRAINDFPDGETSSQGAVLSPFEQSLLELWATVLQRSHVALDDNFFELGGNSLRVMDLTARIRGELSIEVDLIDIYTYPTLRELAERLSADGEGRADATGY